MFHPFIGLFSQGFHPYLSLCRCQCRGQCLCLCSFRLNEDGSWTTIWRSKTVDSSTNPDYGLLEITVSQLCNGDEYRPLQFSLYNEYFGSGGHTVKGVIETSMVNIAALFAANKREKGVSFHFKSIEGKDSADIETEIELRLAGWLVQEAQNISGSDESDSKEGEILTVAAATVGSGTTVASAVVPGITSLVAASTLVREISRELSSLSLSDTSDKRFTKVKTLIRSPSDALWFAHFDCFNSSSKADVN
jgi:hypothetical protein